MLFLPFSLAIGLSVAKGSALKLVRCEHSALSGQISLHLLLSRQDRDSLSFLQKLRGDPALL